MKHSEWERIPDSLRFVPARAKSHMPYFTMRYRRAVKRDGVLMWEEREGKPVYPQNLPLDALHQEDVRLAAKVIVPLVEALQGAEAVFGGPPFDLGE